MALFQRKVPVQTTIAAPERFVMPTIRFVAFVVSFKARLHFEHGQLRHPSLAVTLIEKYVCSTAQGT